jgi:hypothetical protein
MTNQFSYQTYKYKINDLKEMCRKQVTDRMDVKGDSLMATLLVAEELKDPALKGKCLAVVKRFIKTTNIIFLFCKNRL